MNNTKRLASIDFLLAGIPKFSCLDGCDACCGPVVMTRLEMQRICERTGKPESELDFMTVLQSEDGKCPLLDRATHRCTVYDIRPAVCVVFGSTEHKRLKCPHGCKPANPISAKATDDMIDEIEILGHGFPAHSHALPDMLRQIGHDI